MRDKKKKSILKKLSNKFKAVKPGEIHEFDFKLKAGKYKDYSIDQVLDENPKYLLWCIEEGVLKFSNEIYTEIINEVERLGDNYNGQT